MKWAIEERRSEIEENGSGEEDWPNEQHVDQNIHWVSVVRAVEGEVPLEIEQSDLTHRNFLGRFLVFLGWKILGIFQESCDGYLRN